MIPLLLLGLILLFSGLIGFVVMRGLWVLALMIVAAATFFLIGVGATAFAIAVACFFALFEFFGERHIGWAISLSITLGLLTMFLILRVARQEVLIRVHRWRGRVA